MGMIEETLGPLSGNEDLSDKTRIDAVNQCRVIWYQWDLVKNKAVGPKLPVDLPSTSEALLALHSATPYDITDHIQSLSFNKDMGNASGAFSIQLSNSINWQDYMTPGSWIVVYMANDGSLNRNELVDLIDNPISTLKNAGKEILSSPGFVAAKPLLDAVGLSFGIAPLPPLPPGPSPLFHFMNQSKRRFMGVIQRVAPRGITKANGEVDITYTISGKDHGIVFDETTIWFNFFNFERTIYDTFIGTLQVSSRNLTAVMEKCFQLFYDSNNLPELILSTQSNQKTTIGSFSKQWALPTSLVTDLGFVAINPLGWPLVSYFGQIAGLTQFSPTVFQLADANPLSSITSGTGWDALKNLSEPAFHELFTEMGENGIPGIVFRPIPWKRNVAAYPVIGTTIMSMKELINNTIDLTDAAIAVIGALVSGEDAISLLKSLAESKLAEVKATLIRTVLKAIGINEFRSDHSFKVAPVEVESFDVGPNFHERFNSFLVGTPAASSKGTGVTSFIGNVSKFPFRDEVDIQRHGLRFMQIDVNAYLSTALTELYHTDSANLTFLGEINEVIKDYYNEGEALYSGTINLARGRHEVRLGKAMVTDAAQPGIGEMGFYLEGYTDTFSVDENGTASWKQSLRITRGEPLRNILDANQGFAKAAGKVLLDAALGNTKKANYGATFHKNSKTKGKLL